MEAKVNRLPGFVLSALLLAGLTAPALAQGAVLVMAGRGMDRNACTVQGRIEGDAVSVRAGPGAAFEQVDRVSAGLVVNLCDERAGWYGIVYDRGGEYSRCGVGVPLPRGPYTGPCSTGWVSAAGVANLAR